MWIKRTHIEKLEDAIKKRPALLLTGVRQVGKSSLLRHLFPKAEYVTLDKVLLAEEAINDPSNFLDRFESQVIIDEVQYAPSLFRELKVRIDEDREAKGKWILTGSQQFALMEKVSESLAGRIRVLNLHPLSTQELHRAGLLTHQRDFLYKGGFPEIWAQNLEPEDFFEDYIQTYLERDLRVLLNITQLRDFRRLLALLAFRTGQLLNYSELAKDLGVAVNTVKSWISILEITGLVFLLPPYYQNFGKRLIKAPKVYFVDNGILCALLNIFSLDQLTGSIHVGPLWENFVFTELLKHGDVPGKNLFFFRDQNNVEIDFIIERSGLTYLMEAKSHERPDERKLNFRKIAPLFPEGSSCVLASGIPEKGTFKLKNYHVYNPLFGLDFEEK